LDGGLMARSATHQRLDLQQRRELLEAHIARLPASGLFDTERLANLSVGFSSHDLAISVGLAFGVALETGSSIDEAVLEDVILRRNDLGGRTSPSAESPFETAAHEAGHAAWAAWAWGPRSVVGIALKGPGASAGQTLLAEAILERPHDPPQLRRLVGMALAGAVAERMVLESADSSAAAAHDLKRARLLIGPSRDAEAQLYLASAWVERVLAARLAVVRAIAERLTAEPDRALSGRDLEQMLEQAGGADHVHGLASAVDSMIS
jgi:hypothetical protein